MTTKCSVFIATSLDGFVSRPDGSIDWLNTANEVVPPGEDCGFGDFMASVDTLVMGRNTFEQVLSFGEWPYGATPVTVLSHRDLLAEAKLPRTVSVSREEPADLVTRLSSEGRRHIYVDGGLTVQGFLAAGLIDELTLTVIPVLLGKGKTLFGPLPCDVNLSHISTQAYDFGFVQLKYHVKNGA